MNRRTIRALAILLAFVGAGAAACRGHAHNRPPAPLPPDFDGDLSTSAAAAQLEKDLEADQQDPGSADAAAAAAADPDAIPPTPEAPTTARDVSAEVASVDHNAHQITFRVSDDDSEIQLQAGHEITVDFDDLSKLTGLPTDLAISRLREGRDVDLRVVGAGSTARIVKVDLGNF